MAEFKNVPISGYCPYLDGDNTIMAKYQKINLAGDATSYAKCCGTSCDYSSECRYGNECPLVSKALSIKFW